MGPIAATFFIGLGVFLAWQFDMRFLRRGYASEESLEGYNLMQVLKNSKSYEGIRNSQEVSRVGSGSKRHPHRRALDEHRDGGDGGEVLQLRSRK